MLHGILPIISKYRYKILAIQASKKAAAAFPRCQIDVLLSNLIKFASRRDGIALKRTYKKRLSLNTPQGGVS